MLGLVLGSVIVKGASSLSIEFFTEPRGLFGEAGGLADAIVGSLIIVSMATLIAVPIGVLVAIYLSEFASSRSRSSRARRARRHEQGSRRSSSASSSSA